MDNNPILLGRDLVDRTTSGFGLSIGTDLALESLFDPRKVPLDKERKIPDRINITNYEYIFINIATLFRNLAGAVTKEGFIESGYKEIAAVLESEMELINSLFLNEGNNFCKPIYYTCSYSTLFLKYLNSPIHFRPDKTDYQKAYTVKLDKATDILLKHNQAIQKFNTDITKDTNNKILMLTHVPYDLVSYKNFNRLDLLESHTGKLKPRYLWSSKFYPVGDSNLNNLPFLKKTLLIFGDKIMIQPLDIKMRRLVLEIAEKCNWTPLTTKAKVNMDLQMNILEPMVQSFLTHL